MLSEESDYRRYCPISGQSVAGSRSSSITESPIVPSGGLAGCDRTVGSLLSVRCVADKADASAHRWRDRTGATLALTSQGDDGLAVDGLSLIHI